ncbi:hypothetical protein [Brevibacillus sp. SIMBA_040]|uniref:hypothetical protein n=1 Tax=unclassified Brevibacillus TaxID=2684853 RepID=UPI00397A95B7
MPNGLVHLTFSQPVGATKVVLMRSTDKEHWTEAVFLGENAQLAIVTVPLSAPGLPLTTYFKLVVEGGIRAGESNILPVTLYM